MICMDKKHVVYKHTNKINGKVYIGITSIEVKKRWSNGSGYTHNDCFTKAINKYGWDNFLHEILFDNLSVEQACVIEKKLILEYKSI